MQRTIDSAKHATGTSFTEADIDQKHREMMSGFTVAEASILVEVARQQLLINDKIVVREQQGAFIHQTLLKVALARVLSRSRPATHELGTQTQLTRRAEDVY